MKFDDWLKDYDFGDLTADLGYWEFNLLKAWEASQKQTIDKVFEIIKDWNELLPEDLEDAIKKEFGV